MPDLAARPRAATVAVGAARIKAHGQPTISTATARLTSPDTIQAIAAQGTMPFISARSPQLPLKGKTALLIISDGKDIDNRPVGALEDLKKKMGDRLCVYTVRVGNDVQGVALMQQLAGVGSCGFATTAREVAGAGQMTDFVNKVFLAEQVVAPAPAPVKPVVEVDSDGDGVIDRLDKCPGTPRGARVNTDGCWVLADLNFDTDKADIEPDMMPTLNEALYRITAESRPANRG
jgi:OmpA-OmpF porin, OOP family